jgi:polysaccharide deacetylase family protein (PEP-CTERM system associated)
MLVHAQPTIARFNALTVDVEDYFQVSAFKPHVPRQQWDSRECRIERNVSQILDMLSQNDARATFFTLGWLAERYPGLIRRIIDDGHELASHGYEHDRASDLSESAFYRDVDRAKKILEDVGGVQVRGYRAPSFSIGHDNLWAFDVLARAGHTYSSSIFPIRHDHYGMPDAPRFAHVRRGGIVELPASTIRLAGVNLPASGGGYFRLLPYGVSRWMIRRVNEVDRQAAIFYFHPWEIDHAQPRIPGISPKTRFRHYVNLHRVEARLNRLLTDFRWDRVDRIFRDSVVH